MLEYYLEYHILPKIQYKIEGDGVFKVLRSIWVTQDRTLWLKQHFKIIWQRFRISDDLVVTLKALYFFEKL